MTCDQRGDNCVVWSFPTLMVGQAKMKKLPDRKQSHLKGIRVSFLQHEAGATVLKGESTSVRNGYVNLLWANVP